MRNNDKKGSRGKGQGGGRQKIYFSPEERETDKPERTGSRRDDDNDRERKSPRRESDRDKPARRTSRDDDKGSAKKREGSSDDRKSFRRESDRDKPARKTSRDDDKGYAKKREGGSDDRKSFRRESDRDKPARRTSRDDDRGFAKKRESFGSDEGSERKTFRRESDRDKPARKTSRDDDRGFAKKREGYGREEGSERKSFSRESDRDKPARRTSRDDDRGSSRKRDDGDRSERKSFGRDDKGPRGYGENKRRSTTYDKKKGYGDDKRSSSKKSDESWDDSEVFGRDERKRSSKGDSKKESSRKRSSDDAGLIRLNKYISNAGICSRREADDLIKSGVVSVNGKIITEMGYKVKPEDVVRYNNETLKKERMVYVLLNKPKDYITTADDPSGRKTVLELVQGAGRERIYPVGRLDRATTGVLLLTNDGELTKRLTHPRYGVQKMYHVELDKNVKPSDIEKIKDGIELEDGLISADDVAYVGDGQDKTQVGVELHSGRNRIVRRIFEHLGYNVRKLDRVMFAGLTKKDLSRGRWRHLTEKEVGMLYMISSKEKAG
jgi:23S rRNA pseudouridine2605 synthase